MASTAVKELTPETKATVKSTVPVLQQNITPIVTRFYSLLFERYPDVQKMFNMDRQAKGKTKTDGVPSQVMALGTAIITYAKFIDKPERLLPVVRDIAYRHVARGVKDLQYNAVGECIIDAICIELGDAMTGKILEAWKAAFQSLANLFISIEKDVAEKAAKAAGYEGFTTMVVKRILDGVGGDKILYVLPKSGRVPKAVEGQFVAISVSDVPVFGETMLRADIREESDTELRLAVPANGEMGNTKLLNSVKVGDELPVGMPCGEPTTNMKWIN